MSDAAPVTIHASRSWVRVVPAALIVGVLITTILFWNYEDDSTVFLSRPVLRGQIVVGLVAALYLGRLFLLMARMPYLAQATSAGIDGYWVHGGWLPQSVHFVAQWPEVTEMRVLQQGLGRAVAINDTSGARLLINVRAAEGYGPNDGDRLIRDLRSAAPN